MREAVSSGSATGHGDGPEPLWPRLASGDLRPAPAGMNPVLSREEQELLQLPRTRGDRPRPNEAPVLVPSIARRSPQKEEGGCNRASGLFTERDDEGGGTAETPTPR